MNQNHRLPPSDCASFAPLLPLAAQHLLSEAADASLRAHLAGCARCRSELSIYDAVEEALRRSFAPPQGASPPFSREELMQTLDHQSDDTLDQPTSPAPPIAPAAPPRRAHRRLLAGLPAVAALLAVVLIIVTLFATHAGHAPGSGKTTTNATITIVRGSDTELHDISMVSPTEGWAVGYAIPADDPTPPTAVLMHYARGVWSRVQTGIRGRVNSVSMISATDGWAVGDEGLVLHYDGKTWRQVANPNGAAMSRVQMLSATNGWGVGTVLNATKFTGIWHYDGQTWTPQPLPASLASDAAGGIEFESLSMISPTEGWIAGETIPQADAQAPDGSYYATKPPDALILHYFSGQWTVQSTITGASLQSLSMIDANNGWAAGHTDVYVPLKANNGGPGYLDKTAGLLLHYTGGQWTRVANPLGTASGTYEGNLWGAVFASASNGWVIGPALVDAPGLVHYDGQQWTPTSAPAASAFKDNTRFYTIASIAIVSTTEAWAVGYKFSTEAGGIPNPQGPGYIPTVTPVILRYHQGAWSVYPN